MRKDGAYVKKQRLNQITAALLRMAGPNKHPVPLTQILAYCEIEIGLTEKKSLSYLEKLCQYYGYTLEETRIIFKLPGEVSENGN